MSLQPKENCCHVNISVSFSLCIASLCGFLADQQSIFTGHCMLICASSDLAVQQICWLHSCQAINISCS